MSKLSHEAFVHMVERLWLARQHPKKGEKREQLNDAEAAEALRDICERTRMPKPVPHREGVRRIMSVGELMAKADAARASFSRRQIGEPEYVQTLKLLMFDFYGPRESGDDRDADEDLNIGV